RSQLDDGKDKEIFSEEKHFLEIANTLACFAENLNKNWGETARRVYLTVLEHSKWVVYLECFIENALSLKREFLNYLAFKDE
ncbi:unnamed protein product, partial [Larinioides sclopetarius]